MIMKSIVKTLFTLILLGSTLIFLPAHAETAEDSNSEQTITPGDEWSGEIPEPPAETIEEPAIPSEPQIPEQPAPVATPAVTQSTTPSVTPTSPSASPTATTYLAPISTAATSSSENENSTNISEEAETPDTLIISSDADHVSSNTETATAVLIPETARPHTVRKIRLMALISTSIVIFTAIFIWSVVELSKINRIEKIYKTAVQKSIKIKNAKITRAA